MLRLPLSQQKPQELELLLILRLVRIVMEGLTLVRYLIMNGEIFLCFLMHQILFQLVQRTSLTQFLLSPFTFIRNIRDAFCIREKQAPGSVVLLNRGERTGFININWRSDEQAFGVDWPSATFYRYAQIDFNASRVVPTGADNRPYSIKLLPILVY